MEESNSSYPILTHNGKIFPLWILKNFKKYKLDMIAESKNTNIENVTNAVKKYQAFIASYLDYRSPFKDILIYHGLGSGKTVTTINIYNLLYNYNPNWNVFILIKASLKDDPWIKDLNKWLSKNNFDDRYKNIYFIHYDSPSADKDFINKVKTADIQKKNIYIIEEAHNFIKNVYNNIKLKLGKRAFTIYDYIQNEKKDNDNTRIILLSGTPAVNNPFELALIFNLLRPNIFPMSETIFNEIYIKSDADKTLNTYNKNMFQRRIIGLVSYYQGATKDVFADKNIIFKNIIMDDYQQDVYEHFEYIEEQLERKRKGTQIYRSYTRQSSNFVFPIINSVVNGENRPRPSKFKITDVEADKIMQGKNISVNNDINLYIETIKKFISNLEEYFKINNDLDIKNNHTLLDDINIYKEEYKYKFTEFWKKYNKKSNLLKALYSCSCKMTSILFYMLKSKGPVLIYSNYVKMEGIEILKIYLNLIGITQYNPDKNTNTKLLQYTEYHGDIDPVIRTKNLYAFNNPKNIYGDIIKVILISPAGSEGISLMNIRQVHILEPYWNEVRIEQLIGRAVRQGSHKNLVKEEQYVDIYRYFAIRNSKSKKDKNTTDTEIYLLARRKQDLINTFLDTIKEIAVDCQLFKNHNMNNNNYNCFSFNERSYFEGFIGPAYKFDIYDDKKIDNGLNSINSEKKKIKVIKIKAVYIINEEYTIPEFYWYNSDTGIVYDYDLDYPIGKVYIINGIPNKLDDETYIIDELIDIPDINVI